MSLQKKNITPEEDTFSDVEDKPIHVVLDLEGWNKIAFEVFRHEFESLHDLDIIQKKIEDYLETKRYAMTHNK